MTAAPSVVSLGADHEARFVRGLDGRLWWKQWREGSRWTGWRPLGGSTTFLDSPAAVSRNPDVINVYARAHDNRLRQISWERSTGWSDEWQVHTDGGLITAGYPFIPLAIARGSVTPHMRSHRRKGF